MRALMNSSIHLIESNRLNPFFVYITRRDTYMIYVLHPPDQSVERKVQNDPHTVFVAYVIYICIFKY